MRLASPDVGYGLKNFATQVAKANTEPVGSVAVFGVVSRRRVAIDNVRHADG